MVSMPPKKKSKVGFVRKVLEQESVPSAEEPELVVAAVIATTPVEAAEGPIPSSSTESNVETTESSQSISPPVSTTVEEERVTGYHTRYGFQEDTHPGVVCKYCRRDGHVIKSCIKREKLNKQRSYSAKRTSPQKIPNRVFVQESNPPRTSSQFVQGLDDYFQEFHRNNPVARSPRQNHNYGNRNNPYDMSNLRGSLPREDSYHRNPGFNDNREIPRRPRYPPENGRYAENNYQNRRDGRGVRNVMNQREPYADALHNIEVTPLVNEPSRRRYRDEERGAFNSTDEELASYYQRRNGNIPSRQACGGRSDANFDDRYVVRRHFRGDAYLEERNPRRRPDDLDL